MTFSACTTVLGNPSSMKPFWHDGFFMASSIIPTTKSSETRSPCKRRQYQQWSNQILNWTIWKSTFFFIAFPFYALFKIKQKTLSMASLALIPSGVLAATAALNISPVAKWHRQYSSFIIGDWVPFPDPGGPASKKITFLLCPNATKFAHCTDYQRHQM